MSKVEQGLSVCMLAFTASSFQIGCMSVESESTGKSEQDFASVAEGLSFDTSDGSRLRGSFRQDKTVIRFEAVRGERNPEGIRPDDTSPEFAVDARFYGEDQGSFLLSSGGHAVEDEEWVREEPSFNAEQRVAELRLVGPLVIALKMAEVPEELLLERERLVKLGGSIRDVTFVHEPTGGTPYACTNAFVHQMTVRNKAAFDLPIGNHTAVYVDSWFLGTSCTWLYVGRQESCNHGTCATAAEMSTFCTWESGYRSYSFPAFQVYSAYGDGACSTFYNPLSNAGGHNCNDDSYFQIWNIRNDAYYPAATGPSNICIDSVGHSYSPSCTGTRGAP